MGEMGKGWKYLGLAAVVGGVMYGIGKLRSKGKLPLTALGLTAIVLAPKGFELIKSCNDGSNDIKKIEIYTGLKRDSIDAVLKSKEYEKRSKDSTTVYYHDALEKITQENKRLCATYNKLAEKTRGFSEAIQSSNISYGKMVDALEKENKNLEEKINNFKVKESDQQNDHPSNYYANNNSESKDITYYLIDADKSERKITVYGIYNDGSKIKLGVESRASFTKTHGPRSGVYRLSDKGSRDGNMYPGILEMEESVGITGAGDHNQYLDNIVHGAYSNNKGIRIPNGIYMQLSSLVNSKKTLIDVHN